MKTAYHGLLIVNGSGEKTICEWIRNSKFQLEIQSNMSRISAAYSGWGGFGITDKQTGSDLEVLLGDMNGQTAVSIYHHTRSFLIFTSAMMGNILENEADSLMGVLKNEFGIVRQTT